MSTLSPIKKVVIRSQASEVLLKYIIDNKLQRGIKLPSERALAGMLSIGRNTLREALRKLEAVGAVEVINGKGTFIKEVHDSTINIQIETAKVNFMELLDIRRVLENHIIELVIKNATNDDITNIGIKLAKFETACNGGMDAEEFDTAFHHAIYRASKNQTLFDLIRPLAATFHELWKPLGRKNTIFYDTLHLHKELNSAIRTRDVQAAKAAINKILDIDEANVSQQASAQNPEPEIQ